MKTIKDKMLSWRRRMGKRLLSCFTSDFNKMSGQDLKNAIKASEGRTVLSENVVGKKVLQGMLQIVS